MFDLKDILFTFLYKKSLLMSFEVWFLAENITALDPLSGFDMKKGTKKTLGGVINSANNVFSLIKAYIHLENNKNSISASN